APPLPGRQADARKHPARGGPPEPPHLAPRHGRAGPDAQPRARADALERLRKHVAALDARELQLVQLCALLPLELGELLILGIELPLELGNALDVLLDEPDLRGARAAEVAVVGEDAAGERGVLLVEEELQRLLPADGVGGAQLPGERCALLAHLALALMLLGGELRAPCGALGALAAHLGERRAHLADRELGTLELGGQLVALDLLGSHLSGDPRAP